MGMQVLVSVAEHHSNLVPWQLVCQATGATLKHVPLTKDGRDLDMQVCSSSTLAPVHVSINFSDMDAATEASMLKDPCAGFR